MGKQKYLSLVITFFFQTTRRRPVSGGDSLALSLLSHSEVVSLQEGIFHLRLFVSQQDCYKQKTADHTSVNPAGGGASRWIHIASPSLTQTDCFVCLYSTTQQWKHSDGLNSSGESSAANCRLLQPSAPRTAPSAEAAAATAGAEAPTAEPEAHSAGPEVPSAGP